MMNCELYTTVKSESQQTLATTERNGQFCVDSNSKEQAIFCRPHRAELILC